MTETDVQTGLCGYIDQQVQLLRQHVVAAVQRGEVTGVHHARVATRRLKAAIDLAAPLLEPDALRELAKTGKRLRRRLGGLRDADVMIEHLQSLPGSPAVAGAIDWMLELMRAQRDDFLCVVREEIDVDQVLADLDQWRSLRGEVEVVESQAPHAVRAAAMDGLRAFSTLARGLAAEEIRSGPDTSDAQKPKSADPHELRIAGKGLRYTMEIARSCGLNLPADIAPRFKQLQDDLGLWHDMAVLCDSVQRLAVEHLLALHKAGLQESASRLCLLTIRRARQRLRAFQEHWAESGRVVDLALRKLGVENRQRA